MNYYNNRFSRRWNGFIRKSFIMPKLRKRLINQNFTLFSNNCNGGFIYHDFGMKFNSPTINMFFYLDHYFTFLENWEKYIKLDLMECKQPLYEPDFKYPIANLGDNVELPMIELHFMHYKNFYQAKEKWDQRKKRINFNNLFAIFSFFEDTDVDWLKRFDSIPIKNKIAFTNKPYPEFSSAFYIPGYEKNGLGGLGEYNNLFGRRKYDHFNFIDWFNSNQDNLKQKS